MAKGNDGNFPQHSVELAAANLLAAENPAALHDAVEEIEDFALIAAMEDAEEGYSSLETISQILRGEDESGTSKER